MATRKKPEATQFGTHNKLPILARKIIKTNTGDGLSKAVDIVPMDFDPENKKEPSRVPDINLESRDSSTLVFPSMLVKRCMLV